VLTRLVHVEIDCADPARQARFWSAALGWEIGYEEPAGLCQQEKVVEAAVWPTGYSYPEPVALPLVFCTVPEAKATKNRLHLDLATASLEYQRSEVERLLRLGATAADIGQGDVPWTVLADPEGNEFCVLDPRPVYRDTGPVAAVVADCAEPADVADFWELASGFVRHESGDGFVSLRSPAGTGPFLELLRVPGRKTVKDRVHLDLRPWADAGQGAAVAELLAAGAAPADVGQGDDVPWTVLADPAGGEFCVLTPR
jgi:catechol 2,3-dioxygenase-like lactoylglutathione lyase family enzyme